MRGNNHPLPWSRLAPSALILVLLALACFAFNGYAAAKAEAEQRKQTPQNTRQQTQQPQFQATQQAQQQNSSGSLVAVCSDGTRSYSSPGASDYRGMCSHHHGIAQKLGRQ